jgi:ribose 5-phosphate isomerase B
MTPTGPGTRVALAADHHGVERKAAVTTWLTARGLTVHDLGTHGPEVVDYPPLCAAVGRRVVDGEDDWGLVIGGSGQGEVVACNKVRGIRAGLCHTVFATEISRGHNDANVMVVGAKVVDTEATLELLDAWLRTPFEGGQHQLRVEQIMAIEDR